MGLNIDQIVGVAVGNPIVSGIKAGVGVVFNPWMEKPRSFRRRYHAQRIAWTLALEEEILACPDCTNRLNERMWCAGEYYLSDPSSRHELDSHCSRHWDAVVEYQGHRSLARAE